MSNPPIIPVGIDLGTTYSAIARLDDRGHPITLVNAEGDLVTPSVVLVEDTNIVVGKEAIKALATDAEQIAFCAKRDLGQRTFHQMLAGRHYPPEAIEAWILSKLKNDASRQIGEVKQVVITVPAYFDEVRRKATQDAGYMAGLEVLDIINEPTSAAVAFGFQRGFLNVEGSFSEKKNLLVYDLGGGTFDVTVMELDSNIFNALATDGDVQLGGRDWDQRLVDFVAEEFIRTHNIDPREDPNAAGRLWRECEDAKRTLTARKKATVGFDYKGYAVRTEIVRDAFEELTRDLLDRTLFTTRQTLQSSGLEWKDIDHLLLVGGSTRMPMVFNALKGLSGQEPISTVSADEAVAHGAALRAGLILSKHEGKAPTFQIRNVNSHSLGVVATDTKTKRKRNAILIPRNTALPVTAKRVFKTSKVGQPSILVQIVEGESASPDDCCQIGKCVVRDLSPNLPAQTPISVKFRYEENGRLTVMVTVEGTSGELKHEITRENSLSQDQLEGWRQYIAGTMPGIGGVDPDDTISESAVRKRWA